MIVVDASVVVQVLVGDHAGAALTARLVGSNDAAAAPHLLDVEVASVFRRLVREGAVTAERAAEALDDLAAMQVARHAHHDLLPRIWSLRDSLTAYDAAYVALAEALDADLWTRDARLARARGPRCRITVM